MTVYNIEFFQAYKKWVADKGEEKPTPTPHYTNDQSFFLAFAQVCFCYKISLRSGTNNIITYNDAMVYMYLISTRVLCIFCTYFLVFTWLVFNTWFYWLCTTRIFCALQHSFVCFQQIFQFIQFWVFHIFVYYHTVLWVFITYFCVLPHSFVCFHHIFLCIFRQTVLQGLMLLDITTLKYKEFLKT